MVYPPTGSTAYEREMSTPPTLLLEYGPPLPLPCGLYQARRVRGSGQCTRRVPRNRFWTECAYRAGVGLYPFIDNTYRHFSYFIIGEKNVSVLKWIRNVQKHFSKCLTRLRGTALLNLKIMKVVYQSSALCCLVGSGLKACSRSAFAICKIICTVPQKGCHFYFCNNFGKFRPILIILSLLYSQIYC